MDPNRLDEDLETLRRSLHAIDDDKILAVQRTRSRRKVAKHLDGEFDIARLLNAQREGRVATDAPYEKSCSDYLAEQIGVPPRNGFCYVPVGRRALVTDGSAGTGGELVGVDLQASAFIDYYDEFLDLAKLGIKRFSFQRAATIPGLQATVSSYWLDGDGDVLTESDFTFLQKSTSPKTIGALAQVSERLLSLTHPALQARVWAAMAKAVAASVSRAIVSGDGLNGQPAGLYFTPGVGTVPGGSWNYGKILDLIESVEDANALLSTPSSHFIMSPDVARWSRERQRFSNVDSLLLDVGGMAGHDVIVTNAASPSSVVFGDFSSLALCEFSRLQISADPFGLPGSGDFATGRVTIRVLWDIDVIVLNPGAFAYTGVLS